MARVLVARTQGSREPSTIPIVRSSIHTTFVALKRWPYSMRRLGSSFVWILRRIGRFEQQILNRVVDSARKPYRIGSQLRGSEKLQIEFIQGCGETFLSVQIDPIEKGFLRFRNEVVMVAGGLFLKSPIELGRDFTVHDGH